MNIKKENLTLIKKILDKHTIKKVSQYINVNPNTIKRWLENNNIPEYYYFDLKKLNNETIDYTTISHKLKDQFYTNPETSKNLINKTISILDSFNVNVDDYFFIEPSAGDGSFYFNIPTDNKIGMDIEPKNDKIKEQDFLSWIPETKNNIVIGNPPFGLRGNMALKFIQHSSLFSDFVCFILPPIFNSNGKGSPMNRIKNLHLIHTEPVEEFFYYPNGDGLHINAIYQIWSKNIKINNNDNYDIIKDYISVYSLTDGGTPSTTRNKKMLDKCDFYMASSSFEYNSMGLYNSFEELPNRRGYGIVIKKDYDRMKDIIKNINWCEKSFKATNSSYNIRTSIILKSIYEKWESIINHQLPPTNL